MPPSPGAAAALILAQEARALRSHPLRRQHGRHRGRERHGRAAASQGRHDANHDAAPEKQPPVARGGRVHLMAVQRCQGGQEKAGEGRTRHDPFSGGQAVGDSRKNGFCEDSNSMGLDNPTTPTLEVEVELSIGMHP
ncbi:hypothetical protein MTO96_040091 [Rhipicephalus appendiculatus]